MQTITLRSLAATALAACLLPAVPACTGAGQDRSGREEAGKLPDGEPLAIHPELTVRRIAPDAYVVTHDPAYSSNVLIVRAGDGTVVICSSPFDTEATRAMLRWIRGALAPRSILAVNPHYHPDGTAGNEAYAGEGVRTYASELTQKWLGDHGARVRDEAAGILRDAALATRVAPRGSRRRRTPSGQASRSRSPLGMKRRGSCIPARPIPPTTSSSTFPGGGSCSADA